MVARSSYSEANEDVVDVGGGLYRRVVSSGGSGATADQVQGNVAAGQTEAGNPVLIGATANGTPPVYSAGQRGAVQMDTRGNMKVTNALTIVTGGDAYPNTSLGRMIATDGGNAQQLVGSYNFNGTSWDRQRGDTVAISVLPGLSSTFWNYAAANLGIVNTTTAVTVKAAAGASVRNYVSSIELEWETLGTATEFAIRDGAAGTVIYRTKLGTAAGRKTINFPVPLRGTANTLLEIVTLTASGTGAVYANLQGFTGA